MTNSLHGSPFQKAFTFAAQEYCPSYIVPIVQFVCYSLLQDETFFHAYEDKPFMAAWLDYMNMLEVDKGLSCTDMDEEQLAYFIENMHEKFTDFATLKRQKALVKPIENLIKALAHELDLATNISLTKVNEDTSFLADSTSFNPRKTLLLAGYFMEFCVNEMKKSLAHYKDGGARVTQKFEMFSHLITDDTHKIVRLEEGQVIDLLAQSKDLFQELRTRAEKRDLEYLGIACHFAGGLCAAYDYTLMDAFDPKDTSHATPLQLENHSAAQNSTVVNIDTFRKKTGPS